MTIQKAFENFKNSDEFLSSFDSSTKASWGGSGYSVELFPDGSFRVLWNNQIGNLYASDGVIVPIPPLGDEEWDEDETIRFYDNAIDALETSFEEKIEQMAEIA